MKVTIGTTTYTEIRNLSYNAEVDINNNTLPINEYSVEIKTQTLIETGKLAFLYDDNDNLWARYIVTDCNVLDKNWVKLQAKSPIILLDRVRLPAVKYNNTGVTSIIDRLFVEAEEIAGVQLHYVHPYYTNETITGFCPEQTARERLQWICFVTGACVKSTFSLYVEIIPIDNDDETIPANKVYWQPTYIYNDYVTAISLKSYSFTAGTPSTTDDWVTDGTTNYIVTETEHTITNPNAPQTAQENVIQVPSIMLVNEDNYNNILQRLSEYWFNRTQLTADIINNGEYNVPTRTNIFSGYIKSMTFEFGHSARSKIVIKEATETTSSLLTIRYLYNNELLDTREYRLIVGYQYNITTIYIDTTDEDTGVRTIFIPDDSSITGTKASSDETINENCSVAIQDINEVIEVAAVDEVIAVGGVIRIV